MKITIKSSDSIDEYELSDLHITGNKEEDREVTITILSGESNLHVYTSDDVFLTKIKKCVQINPTEWRITRVVKRGDGTISGVMAEGPKGLLTLRSKRVSQNLDEEERQKRATRLKAAQAHKPRKTK